MMTEGVWSPKRTGSPPSSKESPRGVGSPPPLKQSTRTPVKWTPRPLVSICGVCSSPATDVQHYGSISCFSCRAFFRRSVGSSKVYPSCSRGTDSCTIDAVNRTNCKRCRYQKCIKIGMKPEKVDRTTRKRKALKSRQGTPSPGKQNEEEVTLNIEELVDDCFAEEAVTSVILEAVTSVNQEDRKENSKNRKENLENRKENSLQEETINCLFPEQNRNIKETINMDVETYSICNLNENVFHKSIGNDDLINQIFAENSKFNSGTWGKINGLNSGEFNSGMEVNSNSQISNVTGLINSSGVNGLNNGGIRVETEQNSSGYSSGMEVISDIVMTFSEDRTNNSWFYSETGENSLFQEILKSTFCTAIPPTIDTDLTFEEEFRIHELMVRKDSMMEKSFGIIKDVPRFKESFKKFLSAVKTSAKPDMNFSPNPWKNLIEILSSKKLFDYFIHMNGLFDKDLEGVNLKTKAETIKFVLPILHICVRAYIQANVNKGFFLSQHAAAGTLNNSLLAAYNEALEITEGHKLDVDVPSFDPMSHTIFQSPWAARMEDEVLFSETVRELGSMVKDDIKLGTLYLFLVIFTPKDINQAHPQMLGVQKELSLLIFRYLKYKHKDPETANFTTNALNRLVYALHECREIHLHRRIFSGSSREFPDFGALFSSFNISSFSNI